MATLALRYEQNHMTKHERDGDATGRRKQFRHDKDSDAAVRMAGEAGKGLAFRRKMQHLKLHPDTLTRYIGRVNIFTDYIKTAKHDPNLAYFTQEDFWNFAKVMCDDGMHPTTLDGYRYAILHLQKVDGWGLPPGADMWAAYAAVTDAIKGMIRNFKETDDSPKRGAISPDMLKGLLTWCKSNGYNDAALWINVQWHTGLRTSQMMRCQAGDACPDRNTYMLTLRRDKRLNANNARAKDHVHEKPISDTAYDIFQNAAAGVPHGDEIFTKQRTPVQRVYDAIHKASKELKWPAKSYFDAYSCRHGCAAEITKKATDAMKTTMMEEMAQQTISTIKHYARSNEERIPLGATKINEAATATKVSEAATVTKTNAATSAWLETVNWAKKTNNGFRAF